MDIGNNKELERTRNKRRLIVFLNNYSALISFGLAAFILTIGLIYYIYPKYQTVSQEMSSTADAQKQEIKALNSYMVKLNDYLTDYASISKSEIDRLDLVLPEEQYEKEQLFAYMENFFDGRGLMVESISISAEKAVERNSRRPAGQAAEEQISGSLPAQIRKVVMDVDLIGLDYDGLKRLLRDIEQNLRLLDVRDLHFRQNSKEASLSIATYYFLPSE